MELDLHASDSKFDDNSSIISSSKPDPPVPTSPPWTFQPGPLELITWSHRNSSLAPSRGSILSPGSARFLASNRRIPKRGDNPLNMAQITPRSSPQPLPPSGIVPLAYPFPPSPESCHHLTWVQHHIRSSSGHSLSIQCQLRDVSPTPLLLRLPSYNLVSATYLPPPPHAPLNEPCFDL